MYAERLIRCPVVGFLGEILDLLLMHDRVVLIDDDALKDAMGVLFRELKIAVEPACTATTAALMGPLSGRYSGKKVVAVMCGSNIDWQTFAQHANLGGQYSSKSIFMESEPSK